MMRENNRSTLGVGEQTEVTQLACISSEMLATIEITGCMDSSLVGQSWLKVFSSGEDIRSYIKRYGFGGSVWIVSSDDISPINIAASIKADKPQLSVVLISSEEKGGSLASRMQAAHIDEYVPLSQFPLYYHRANKAHSAYSVQREFEVQASKTEVCGAEVCGTETLGAQAPHTEASIKEEKTNSSYQKAPECAPHDYVAVISESSEKEEDYYDCMSLLFENEAPDTASGQQSDSAVNPRFETVPMPSYSMDLLQQSALREGLGGEQPKEQSKHALLIPVVSGGGGTGKSTVSCLLALQAQRRGYKTLLIDLDLQFGDIDALLGVKNVLRADEVLKLPFKAAQLECSGAMPALIGAPKRLEDYEVVREQVPRLLDYFSSSFDVIVVNTGASWDEYHAALLERAPKSLFLIDQRPSSVRAAKHALDLCSRLGIAINSFVFAVNRCGKKALFSSMDVSCALGGSLTFELAEGFSDVEELLGAGLPFELLDLANPLCESIECLLDDAFSLSSKASSSKKERSRKRKIRFALFSSAREGESI